MRSCRRGLRLRMQMKKAILQYFSSRKFCVKPVFSLQKKSMDSFDKSKMICSSMKLVLKPICSMWGMSSLNLESWTLIWKKEIQKRQKSLLILWVNAKNSQHVRLRIRSIQGKLWSEIWGKFYWTPRWSIWLHFRSKCFWVNVVQTSQEWWITRISPWKLKSW